MIRNLILIIFSFTTILLHAQEKDTLVKESGILWEITHPDIDQPSYVFGTIHMIERELFYFPDTLDSLIINSDKIVMELDESISNTSEIFKYTMLDSGSVLDFLTSEQEDSLLNWFDTSMNISPELFKMSFSKMKPIVIFSMTTMMNSDENEADTNIRSKENEISSYDLTIQEIGIEYSKEIIGLETISEQMQMFDNMDTLTQAELIMSGIRPSTEEADFNTISEIYLTQDIEKLYELTSGNLGGMDASESALLDDRNINWVPKIIELIKVNSCFIAVGAGHLGGPNGLIKLLIREGYQLTPIKI